MSLSFFLQLFWDQWTFKVPYPTQDFTDKTVIVTGANVGLGFEAARHITRLNAAKVIIACRTVEKGEAARADIEKTTGRKGVIEVWPLDLCSFQSIREFAARAETLKRLDVVLENAGISTTEFKKVEEDEMTVTTNVTSTFLLGLLLLPKLKETARTFDTRPVLSIVSSEVHALTNLPQRNDGPSLFDALNNPKTARMSERYQASKLLEVLAVREMVARNAPDVDKYPVTINYLNPGFCHSELMREANPATIIMKYVMGARTTEVGSRTLVSAVGAGPETHGQYLSNCKPTPPSPFVRSAEGKKTQERVWHELSAKLERIQPGILANI